MDLLLTYQKLRGVVSFALWTSAGMGAVMRPGSDAPLMRACPAVCLWA